MITVAIIAGRGYTVQTPATRIHEALSCLPEDVQ